jgi:Flp pilus assembly protein TadD
MAVTPEDQLDGAHWEAVEEVAEVLQEGQYQQALYLLRDLAREDPRNPYIYYFMGVAFYEIGRLEEARDAFRAAVKLEPRYLGARGSLAQVLRRLRDYRGAIAEGKAALALRNDDPDALHALGMAYAALGQRSDARRYLEAFLRARSEYEPAQEVQFVLQLIEQGHGPVEIA